MSETRPIDPRVVGYEADTLAAQGAWHVGEECLDPRSDASGRCRCSRSCRLRDRRSPACAEHEKTSNERSRHLEVYNHGFTVLDSCGDGVPSRCRAQRNASTSAVGLTARKIFAWVRSGRGS